MTKEQQDFVKEIETVSTDLARWVQEKFSWDWSIVDVKVAIRCAAKVCGKEL